MADSTKVLSDLAVFTKYARFIPEKNRRENWKELCDRNRNMHLKKYPELSEEINEVYKEFIETKKVLFSMRSAQFAGKPIEISPNRIYNCCFAPIDHYKVFGEIMFLLLGGTGAGYSVQSKHVEQLPEILKPKKTKRYVVSDSIEGWADAVKALMKSYFYGTPRPIFDYSDIRPKGALLVTSGGKAPGPEPLKKCLERLKRLLDKKEDGDKLKPLECHDIVCHIADAVLSGGIRRAALISLFDMNDEDMVGCKSELDIDEITVQAIHGQGDNRMYQCTVVDSYYKNRYEINVPLDIFKKAEQEKKIMWYFIHPYRARSNNSAVVLRHKIRKNQFKKLWKRIEDSRSGEPGVYFSNNEDWGCNPCVEIGLRPYQFCNLTEVNVSDVESQEDLNARVRAAAFLGTLQAGYTDFHYLRDIWKKTTERDALLGVSMTGIASGNVLKLDLTQAAEIAIYTNKEYAKKIGIKPAARVTCVKPAGTTSLVLGCSSGIHAWYDKYYVRTMRFKKNETIYKYIKRKLPKLVEDDIFDPDGAVISIPIKAPRGATTRKEKTIEMLERVKKVTQEWVTPGHIKGDNAHNVSATVNVRDNEWEEVGEWMWANRKFYNGLSVLPYDNGIYKQAPFQTITKEKYDELVEYVKEINLDEVRETEDATDLKGEIACAGGICEIG